MRAILRVLSKACGWIKTEYDKYFVRLSLFIIPALVVLLVIRSIEVHNLKYELSVATRPQVVFQKPTIIHTTTTLTNTKVVVRVVYRTRRVKTHPAKTVDLPAPIPTKPLHIYNVPCPLFNKPLTVTSHEDAVNTVGHICQLSSK